MKFTNPKGTRDFSPSQVQKRNYIFNTLRKAFETFGFQPIETPAMENLSTLTGKYGDEGDQLLFKILRNGDFLKGLSPQQVEDKDLTGALNALSNKGLRYDLTVPFARFVVQYQNDIQFPFKRYQIQPVWRADRPQKGRYQEFFQCDADVVGSESLMLEAELLQLYDQVFDQLNIPVQININNRKILKGIAQAAGAPDFTIMTAMLDKLDKIGKDKVRIGLTNKGFSDETVDFIFKAIEADLPELETLLKDDEEGKLGIAEYKEVLGYLEHYTFVNELKLDLTLARGLSYYTGCIFEVAAKGVSIGSIGGGGRYSNLTETFGLKNMPGVGISFGAARIYDVLEELGTFPAEIQTSTKLLLVAMDQPSHTYAFSLLTKLRSMGLISELYPEPVKVGKQMKYADKRQIPFVAIIGETERETGVLSLKNMVSGEQSSLRLEEIVEKIK